MKRVVGKALGLLRPRFDVRTLKLRNYLKLEVPPPSAVNWLMTRQVPWPMFDNDRYGCCTCAAAGHSVINWTDDSQRFIEPTTADILAAYASVSGFELETGLNDNGAVALDVLKFWQREGIAGRKIGAFASINPKDLTLVKQAIWLFGGVYTGFALPQSAADQELWDVGCLAYPKTWPWSWGGHAMMLGAYGSNGRFTAVTWGKLQQLTDTFFRRYCVECYAVLSPDWLNPYSGLAVNGFDLNKLREDLKAVQR